MRFYRLLIVKPEIREPGGNDGLTGIFLKRSAQIIFLTEELIILLASILPPLKPAAVFLEDEQHQTIHTFSNCHLKQWWHRNIYYSFAQRLYWPHRMHSQRRRSARRSEGEIFIVKRYLFRRAEQEVHNFIKPNMMHSCPLPHHHHHSYQRQRILVWSPVIYTKSQSICLLGLY